MDKQDIVLAYLSSIAEILERIADQLEANSFDHVMRNDEPSGAPQQPCMYN